MLVPPFNLCNSFLVPNILVFIVIAVTATVTNGANVCPEPNDNGLIDCENRGLTSIPLLPREGVYV